MRKASYEINLFQHILRKEKKVHMISRFSNCNLDRMGRENIRRRLGKKLYFLFTH